MKRFALKSLAFGLFATMVSASTEPQMLSGEDEFRDRIVGKELRLDGIAFTLNDNGTFSGDHRGMIYHGIWNWEGETLCRSSQVGGRALGTDCQMVALDGVQVSFLKEQGKADPTRTFSLQ